MTILDIQRRIREAGRIRIGQRVGDNGRPVKLETFRITSPDRRAIEQAAGMYGGQPEQWDAPAGRQWQVVTETDELDVIVPPSEMAFSQHYEKWASGGCVLRCDGITETIGDRPCICDPEQRECSPHTRLSVMLRDLAGLGVWRLDTQGYYAAVELAGAVQVVQAAAGAGVMLPARLRLEQRQVKRQGEPRRDFAVPVLDVEVTPAQLLGGQGGGMALHSGAAPAGTPALDDRQAAQGNLTPVPDSVPERPAPPVADQAAGVGQPGPPRANAAADIPAPDLAPPTAAGMPDEPQIAAPGGEDLSTWSHSQLREECKRLGLKVSGRKRDLAERIYEHRASGSSTLPEAPETGSAPAAPADEPDTPSQDPPPPPAEDGEEREAEPHLPRSISSAQLTKLQTLFRELGIRGDGVSADHLYRASLMALYSVDSSKHLSANQAHMLIEILSNGRLNRHGVEESPQDLARQILEKGAERLHTEDEADVTGGGEGEEASDAS